MSQQQHHTLFYSIYSIIYVSSLKYFMDVFFHSFFE